MSDSPKHVRQVAAVVMLLCTSAVGSAWGDDSEQLTRLINNYREMGQGCDGQPSPAAGPLAPGVAYSLSLSSGTLALDGEREIEFSEHDRPTVTLDAHGPLSIDVEAVLAYAARHRLLAVGREHPQHPANHPC